MKRPETKQNAPTGAGGSHFLGATRLNVSTRLRDPLADSIAFGRGLFASSGRLTMRLSPSSRYRHRSVRLGSMMSKVGGAALSSALKVCQWGFSLGPPP